LLVAQTETEVRQQWVGTRSDQSLPEFDIPSPGVPTRFVVVATTARSGSNMLCSLLRETKRFGVPLEYAHPTHRRNWARRTGKTALPELLAAMKAHRTTPNGVFTIKIHWSQVRWFGGFQGLLDAFPGAAFVHLVRHDTLGQAVSLARAMQTGVWLEGRNESMREPLFNPDQVDACLIDILLDNNEWRYAFACHGIRPVSLSYEEVREDPVGTVAGIAERLGIDLAGADVPAVPPTRRQAGRESNDWARQFVASRDYDRLVGRSGLRHFLKTIVPRYFRARVKSRPTA
jgi:LPS sulfotransferase NodH